MTLITQCALCGERLEVELPDEKEWKLKHALELEEPILEGQSECSKCKEITFIQLYGLGYTIV